mgnify:CR=1 FL=1
MDNMERKLAEAMHEMLEARDDLTLAKANVPDYTGQYSEEHYYRYQQAAYDKAIAYYCGVLREFIADADSMRTR